MDYHCFSTFSPREAFSLKLADMSLGVDDPYQLRDSEQGLFAQATEYRDVFIAPDQHCQAVPCLK
jgi:hypothetical protein